VEDMDMADPIVEKLYGPALLGAIIAALGYISKLVVEWIRSVLIARAQRRSHLQELEALLEATDGAFKIQNGHRNLLQKSLQQEFPDECKECRGYEDTFAKLYPKFTEEQKKRHGLIRSITENAMRPGNQALRNWLSEDRHFKTRLHSFGDYKKLAVMLRQLELHLSLWEAKFLYWIPDSPEHALVYLNDEERHGVAFPYDIDKLVHKMLGNPPTPREKISS
jgi:hypothetical protein